MKYAPLLILLVSSAMLGQVTVVNPKHLEFPKDKINLIFRIACKVVAEEFHVPEKAAESEFPLTLILGDPNERYTEDEQHHLYAVYLEQWNEEKFTVSAMRLAIQHMVPQSRRDKMAREILRRSNQVAPVAVTTLAKHHH